MKANYNPCSDWVMYLKSNPASEERLFCFPYAGGSSIVFRKWPEKLPQFLEVGTIELPGRGRRLNEPLLKNISELVDVLTEAIYPHLNKPFNLFGHSMGALIAFELACSLKKRYGREPEHLYVSAHAAPQVCKKENPIYNLPKDEFIQKLLDLNGIPKEVVSNEELMDLVIPILRADFTVCETYKYEQNIKLSCPITVFGGVYDKNIDIEDLEAWADLTTSFCQLHLIPGDHFFISKCEQRFLDLLSSKFSDNKFKVNLNAVPC